MADALNPYLIAHSFFLRPFNSDIISGCFDFVNDILIVIQVIK